MLNCIFGSLLFSWSLTVSCRNDIIFDVSLCKCLFLGHKRSQTGAKLSLLLHVRAEGWGGRWDTARPQLLVLRGTQRGEVCWQHGEGDDSTCSVTARWVATLLQESVLLHCTGNPFSSLEGLNADCYRFHLKHLCQQRGDLYLPWSQHVQPLHLQLSKKCCKLTY